MTRSSLLYEVAPGGKLAGPALVSIAQLRIGDKPMLSETERAAVRSVEKRLSSGEGVDGAMKDLATCPNVHMKLGGLGMAIIGFDFHKEAKPPSSDKLAAAWRPLMGTSIELFGAKRCMFESNFPVDKGMFSYPVMWNAFKRIASGASAADKAALFHDTAARFYRLK